ncbi:MAG: DUF2845 domain-containing protein [Dokdonella sp.]
MIIRTIVAAIFLASAPTAWALRCGTQLVGTGDQDFQVRARCGGPVWIERTSELTVLGARGPFERQHETPIEVWTYNFGPQSLMRRLTFRNGVMSREETLGYGVREVGRDCNTQASYEGFSVGELVAHCGQPLSRRRGDEGVVQRPAPGIEFYSVEPREELIYDLGDRLRLRRYFVVDGRVIDSDTLER